MMDNAEMIEILEQIARDSGNAAARIAAIRALRELESGQVPDGAFADLDQLAPKRRLRAVRTKGE